MAENVEKQFAELMVPELYTRYLAISCVDFTEEVQNKYLPKFQDDENFKKKIKDAHHFVIDYLEASSKLETVDEKARQIAQGMISETTIADFINEVYEILCRLAILEEVKDDVASLEKFYEETISIAIFEYITLFINKVNCKC